MSIGSKNKKTSLRVILNEICLRIVQTLVSVDTFDYPPLLNMRKFILRLVFNIPRGFSCGHNCYFIKADALVNIDRQANLKMGCDVMINHNVELDYSGGLTIGDDVWIS